MLRDFFKNLAASVLAIAGLVTTVISVVQLSRSENYLFWIVIALIGIAVLWLTCFYTFLKKKPTERSVGFKHQNTEDVYLYGKKNRRLALVGIIMVPLLCGTSYFVFRYLRNLPSNKTIIMVANFESLDGQNYGVTEKIIEDLRRETLQYSDVEIQGLNTSIAARDGAERARIIGAEHKATVFLWGWYRKTTETALISVHVEVLKKPTGLTLRSDNQELIRPAREIDSFEVQTRLSHDLTYLTLVTVGLARMELEKYSDAISLFTRAIQLSAAPENLIDPGNIYLFRGTAYLGTHSYKEAIEDFTKSLSLTTATCGACALNNRAIAYVNLGNLDNAVSDFLQSRERDPEPASIHSNLGVVYRQRGELDKAIQSFKEAVNRDPTLAKAYRHLAEIYLEQREFDKAIDNCSEFLKLEPDNWQVLHNRGVAFIKLEKYSQGVDDLNLSIRLKKEAGQATQADVRSIINKDVFIREMARYTELINSQPNSENAYVSRAVLYNSVSDYERAVQDLDKAVSINPESSEAYHQRGKAKEALGLKNEAVGDFQKFLQLAKDDVSQRHAKEHLEHIGVPH